jgi:hypothetical protein
MSTLLEQASLVMIPSGYKEDIVYSQIPTNGNGDLSFTRASNGTRINSAGLVEVCPWNLLQYSEDFNAGWTLIGGGSFTSNAATAPNGTTTADEYDLGGYVRQYLTMPLNNLTFTFYVRAKTSSASFRIGILGSGDSAIAQTIETVGTSWTQMSVTYNNFGGSAIGVFFNIQSGDSEVYIWGAQLNIGSTAKPYFPTTDRLNVPRLTYQNGGGGCPSLLLEKQSTNLMTYSEQFDQADWTKRNATISANATTSPDGTQNADKLQEDTATGQHDFYQYFACVNGNSYSMSFYAKASERTFCVASFSSTGLPAGDVFFNLQTGVVVSAPAGITATMTSVGNGWYRCVMSAAATSTEAAYFVYGNASNGSTKNYAGTSGSGTFIWGAQVEASSYPTSYIPTTSASATRVADACFKTGISSLIGQTEGTLFADSILTQDAPSNEYLIQVSASGTNRFFIYREGSTNKLGCFAIVAGNVIYTQLTAAAITGRVKAAFAYSSGSFAFYVNGVQVGTSAATFGTPASMGIFNIDSNAGLENGFYNYNQAILFKTRLTNTELASLTTI